jgi:hypothetical protein
MSPAKGKALRVVDAGPDDARALMLAYLEERGISEAHADAAGFAPLDTAETAGLTGKAACGRASFRIPYRDHAGEPVGFEQLRFLGEPIGFKPTKAIRKPLRYWQPSGSPTPAYLSPVFGRPWSEIATDPAAEIVVTEGAAKATAACVQAIATVGVTSVDTWHAGGDKDALVRGLDAFAMKGRLVAIAFDSDAATKPGVVRAESELRAALEKRGAFVQIVRLPPAASGAKQGLDDFLVAEGPDAFRKLMNGAERLPDALEAGGALFDTEFPPIEFAIKPYLPKAELVEIHGAHGQFKSTIMLYAALSVASGERWNDCPVTPGRSVFISLEDRSATLALRVKCWTRGGAKVHGPRDPAAIARREMAIRDRFQFLGREKAAPLVLTKTEFGQSFARTAVVERIVKLCAGANLVVLETAARLHPGGETNEALAVLAGALETIATRTGACVVLVRHVAKEQARSGSVDSYGGRGGGSLADAARSVLSVGREGEKSDDPVKVVHTKSTHSVRGQDLLWRPEPDGEGVFLRALTEGERARVSDARWLDTIRFAGEEGITKRELERKVPSRGRAKALENLGAALARLVSAGQARVDSEQRGQRGPEVSVYRVAGSPPTGGKA